MLQQNRDRLGLCERVAVVYGHLSLLSSLQRLWNVSAMCCVCMTERRGTWNGVVIVVTLWCHCCLYLCSCQLQQSEVFINTSDVIVVRTLVQRQICVVELWLLYCVTCCQLTWIQLTVCCIICWFKQTKVSAEMTCWYLTDVCVQSCNWRLLSLCKMRVLSEFIVCWERTGGIIIISSIIVL